nr:LOW QUALITY PROTEIN: protein tyrosine phosphatase type IVA 1-like [Kogia breviceps]
MARINHPALVEVTYKNMRFLNPTNATLNKFIEELKKYGVTTIARICEATFDTTLVEKEGIHVLDWPFDDGTPPSNQIVDDWLSLMKINFHEDPGCCIAVHCVAGLGRGPGLVALALIEGGMKYEDAVHLIRQSSMELPTASNFCISRSIVLKCGCASKTPMVIGTTVGFNKTGVPDAIAWKWNLDRTEFVVHVSQHVGFVNSDEASIEVSKSSFTRPQAWQNCSFYVWVMTNLLGHVAKDSCCSAFKMCLLSFVPIDLS